MPTLTPGSVGHEPVRIGRVDVHEAGRARLEHRPERRQTGGAHRGQRQAVVGAPARDDRDLAGPVERLPVEPRRLERGLARLGPAAGEEERVDRGIEQRAQLLGQRDGRQVAAAGVGGLKGERGHLRLGGARQFAAAVANVDVPQSGEPVDVGGAGGIGDDGALAFHPDPGRPNRRRMVQRMQQVRMVGGDRVVAGKHGAVNISRGSGPSHRSGPHRTTR